MSGRGQVLAVLTAAYTGVCVFVIAFLTLGLLSRRVSRSWEDALYGGHALPAMVLSAAVATTGIVLAYRWALRREAATNVARFFRAVGSSLLSGMLGAAAFTIALNVLPRSWFSRGGDWDFEPLLEVAAFSLTCAVAGFWLVYRWAHARASAPRP